jgi:hypothetical protein
MAWHQEYDAWRKQSQKGEDYWVCAWYIWTDGSMHYYRHLVYYNPQMIAGLNTQDYFYFRDANANNVYCCRCLRKASTKLRWSYLGVQDYRDAMAMLRDEMFPEPVEARSLSIAGANPPPDQVVDSGFTQHPPRRFRYVIDIFSNAGWTAQVRSTQALRW